jgi:ectoine hydroxylase-related dioxygenase (phytanoyl-CoA dioxygenase family)
VRQFEEAGFLVVRGLFGADEIDRLCAEFTALHAAGPVRGHFEPRPGDVLFFNGSLVHGSQPNRTEGRFRRSFIGHYVGASAERIGAYYRTLSMRGERVALRESEDAGPCGTEFAPQGPH